MSNLCKVYLEVEYDIDQYWDAIVDYFDPNDGDSGEGGQFRPTDLQIRQFFEKRFIETGFESDMEDYVQSRILEVEES